MGQKKTRSKKSSNKRKSLEQIDKRKKQLEKKKKDKGRHKIRNEERRQKSYISYSFLHAQIPSASTSQLTLAKQNNHLSSFAWTVFAHFYFFDARRLERIEEKPIRSIDVNAGIYFFSPDVLDVVHDDEFLDAPELVNRLIKLNHKVCLLRHSGGWRDYAYPEDLSVS